LGTLLQGLGPQAMAATQNQLDEITKQTMNMMKDATTQGFTTGDGLYGFGLEAPAKLIFPLTTPFLNSIPRKKAGQGSDAARWKAIVGFKGSGYRRQRPTTGFGYAGNLVQTVEQDFVAPYKPISLGDSVQMDAQAMARGFDNLRAKSGIKTLYELKIGEDIQALGGQNFALQTPSAPSLTYSATGGSITNGGGAAVTWKVVACAVPIEGFHYGDPTHTAGSSDGNGGTYLGPLSTVASTAATVSVPAGATTGSITTTVTSVPGAAAYDWYVDNGLGGNLFFTGLRTTTNTATITAAALDTNPTPPAADASADQNSFNGYVASLVGDYTSGGQVTRGTGTRASGATIVSLNGATLTGNNGSIQEIDNVLLSLGQNLELSPTRLVMNNQQAFDMTDKMFATGGFRVMLQAGQKQDTLTGGVYIERYINKAWQGQMLQIVVDPHVPPGTIIGCTDVLPYPDNTVDSVLEIQTLEEYHQVEYAMARIAGQANGGPRYDYEIRAEEVLKNYFPAGGFIIQNIGQG
jgi:hypothetical protein